MENIIYEIGRMVGLDLEVLRGDNEAHKKKVGGFRNLRVAGLQGIVDYIFSKGGDRYAPSVDVTEFFRSGEEFKVGYGLFQKSIGSALKCRVGENDIEGLKEFINSYSKDLDGDYPVTDTYNRLRKLKENNFHSSCDLFDGNYMNAEKNVVRFDGKRIIVTGSDTGIGRAVALEFLRRGAKVALHYPTYEFERGAKSAVELAKEYGRGAEAFQGDFRNLEEIGKFAKKAIDYLGGVDILINNAGITWNKKIEDVDHNTFMNLMSVNLGGTYFVTQAVIPYMIEQGRGIIFNFSSPHGLSGYAGHSVYATTKGGIKSLTQQLAVELAPEIRVNAIVPGWVAGRNHFELMPELNFMKVGEEARVSKIVLSPRRMANHVVSLASDEFDHISGQTITIDGGQFAGMNTNRGCCEYGDKPWGKKYFS